MKFPAFASRSAWCVLGLLVALGGAACQNIFVPRRSVFVDAIAGPGAEKPSGKSYKLVAKRSVVNATPVRIDVLKACVDAALAGTGMFEAPDGVPPDLFIEVGFGQDSTPRIDATVRETFLDLSARTNPNKSLEHATGTEIWDVRVAMRGLTGRIESAMPILAAIATEYVATDTHIETKVEVPDNSPIVSSVREHAIATLDAKTPAPPADGSPPAQSGPRSGSVPAGPAPAPTNASAVPSTGGSAVAEPK